MIPALVTGDRRGLEPPLWRLFRDLGTAHLLAISGLHLTLVTGLLWGLGRWLLAPLLWLACPPARRFSLQQWAWAPALAGALGYAALAGFALPTQRALIMVAVLAACRPRPAQPAGGGQRARAGVAGGFTGAAAGGVIRRAAVSYTHLTLPTTPYV